MKKFSFFAILTISLILLPDSLAQHQPDYDKLDKYISNAVKEFKIPGLAVGIVKNNEIVFTKGYGVRNTETDEPVTPETVFGIASVTKAFTAACIGILVDEGKLKWDDKVTDYLPWFKMSDSYVASNMTIRDLLCHRSGLATFDGDLLWYGTNYSRKEVVERISSIPLTNGFREKFGYQNLMFITAGEVVEAVTGKTWDEFLQDKIFGPLGMKSTNTSNSKYSKGDNWALPHINGKPQSFINYDNSGGAASINSNVADLLKWLQMWLNKGTFNGQKILSEESIYNITSPQLVMSSGLANEKFGTHLRTYGMGWFLWDYSGRKIIEHSGGLPGFHTKAAIVPEDSLGIVILANQINFLINPLLNKILDFYLNDKDIDYAANSLVTMEKSLKREAGEKKQKEDRRISGTSPSLPLNDYAGTYEDKTYGKAEITYLNEKLILSYLPAKELFTGKLEHWHLNTFKLKFNDPYLPEGFITFNFNSDGKILGFKIDLPNPDFLFYNMDFKKTF